MPPRRECFGSAESEKICRNDLAFAFRILGETRSSNSFACFSYGGYKPLRATVTRGISRDFVKFFTSDPYIHPIFQQATWSTPT
jgi:hypothetical protein